MASAPEPGLREQLVTGEVRALITSAEAAGLEAEVSPLANSEAPDRLSRYVGEVVRQAIEALPESEQAAAGAELIRAALLTLGSAKDAKDELLLAEPPTVLGALLTVQPDGTPRRIPRPLTPLSDTTVFTNARGDPRVGHELEAEIGSAVSIDLVVAFIRHSGVAPMLDAIRRHCDAGRKVRVLTTTFTGATEPRALDALREAGASVRVSYDVSASRLHAKAWIFHRDAGYSTAYIGSSNLTRTGHESGLEWNVRLSGVRNADAVAKVSAVFESYWNSGDFIDYDAEAFRRALAESGERERVELPAFDIEPRPFQERLLELIEVSRRAGHHKNLLVAATGTGKTVMAAIDYARLRRHLPRARLLFVAHREEILDQSRSTFRVVLRDMSFGEKWVAGERPTEFEHVFASIQSLHDARVRSIDSSHFDVVIVDEFHHAAAKTYRALLNAVEPRELLGLTATPERADQLDVLSYFGGRIAAELRIWDAIDQQYLVPFAYYGIHDGVDMRNVRWRRGSGYDVAELTNVLTSDQLHVRRIVDQLEQKADDVSRIRALGFCVSVAHAEFMAKQFSELGLPSVAVSAETPREQRRAALRDLEQGRVRAVFAVDLFNEGVDLPDVDTLLLLRPTDSPTLFLQQLGRGLRRSIGKAECLVLDFVGLHRKEFRLDRRFRALLGGSRQDLRRQVEQGFPFLPAGCHLELDRVARGEVLRSIRESLPTAWRDRCTELSALGDVSLEVYLAHTGLDLEDIYSNGHSWAEMRRATGFESRRAAENESAYLRAVGRLLHVDDDERLDAFARFASATDAPRLDDGEARLLRMLVASLTQLPKSASLGEAVDEIWSQPPVLDELRGVIPVLKSRVDHLHIPVRKPPVPLQVHARYTRQEVLASFSTSDRAHAPEWREGVRYERDHDTDIFAFTLDKTSGGFSPTTRYRDYAISRDLIHWESQSGTSAASVTGRRYIEQRESGTTVLLFARLRADERAFWCLGPATYVQHQGERPIAITWRLENPLPGDLFAEFTAAVA